MMYQKRWFQGLVTTILIFVLILLVNKTEFVFDPVFTYIQAVAFPILAAGLLYYVSRPLMRLLETYKVPRIAAIFVVFLLIILVIYLIATYIAPIAQKQFSKFIDSTPDMVNEVESIIAYWQSNQVIIPDQFNDAIEDARNTLVSSLQGVIEETTKYIFIMVTGIVQFLFLLILVPFFLFFMLKDGDKLQPFLTKFFKEKRAESLSKLLKRVDHTLSAFIQGQLLVSVCVGVLLYIGYVIIGLNYSLSLALFGMLTNVIPFAGPFLAVIPAVLVAAFQDPMMIWYVLIIMIIAQQIEGNLISPNIMGKALDIHPLTIITLILAAGSIAGFLGLLFVIPFYGVIKTTIAHFYEDAFHSKKI